MRIGVKMKPNEDSPNEAIFISNQKKILAFRKSQKNPFGAAHFRNLFRGKEYLCSCFAESYLPRF